MNHQLNMSNKKIVAVEIGSSKIKAAVGTVAPDGNLIVERIESEYFSSPNYVRYGVVQNTMEVANALTGIFMKLNNVISPAKISAVYVGVGGRSTMAAPQVIEMGLPDETEITVDIVDELLNRAEIVADPDREVVEVCPGKFMVDGMSVDLSPVGNVGNSLSVNVATISCRSQNLRNLAKSITDKLNYKINGYVVRQTALADMVLTSEDKELGVMLVDFGAETTTVSIYKNNALLSLVTLPLGSRHITRDIMACNYSEERAEEIKKAVGCANPDSTTESQRLHIEGINDAEINCYVAARAGEIVVNIMERLSEIGLETTDLPQGIVVAGNGSLLQGFIELLAEQSAMSVRRATVPASVRCRSSKVQLAEHIDVVALLHHLASGPTQICTVLPTPMVSVSEPQETKEAEDTPAYQEEVVEGKKSSFLNYFKKKIGEMINPSDIDDSDVNFDEE